MPACILCKHPSIEEQREYPRLLRVTSDSRIWRAGGRLTVCPNCHTVQKPPDQKFLKEVDEIYATYQPYFQSKGQEQKIFAAGSAKPRSDVLLDHILPLWPL